MGSSRNIHPRIQGSDNTDTCTSVKASFLMHLLVKVSRENKVNRSPLSADTEVTNKTWYVIAKQIYLIKIHTQGNKKFSSSSSHSHTFNKCTMSAIG